MEDLKAMRTRELKKELESMGISTEGCVDKEALLERLEAAGGAQALLRAAAKAKEPVVAEVVDTVTSEVQLDAEAAAHLEQLRALKTRDLKAALQSMGVRTQGCVDRDGFTQLLETQGLAALSQGARAELGGRRGLGRKKKKKGAKRGFAEEPAASSEPDPNDPLKAQPSPELPPPARPKKGLDKIRIHRMTGTDQHGVRADDVKVLALDLELGPGGSPCRFVLDTVTYHSVIKAEVADALAAKVIGPASWASAPDSQSYGINQVKFNAGWLGKIELGPCEMASVEGELPIPMGCCGILGLDFLKLFDWDFDVKGEEAEVATVPRDLKGPVPFDLDGMHVATLMKVRLPTGLDLLASPIQVKLPGSEDEVEVMGIADLCAASSICNGATLDKLGISAAGLLESGAADAPKDGASEAASAPGGVLKRPLQFIFGRDGPLGPVTSEAPAATGDVEVFDTLGLASNWPAAILGPDILCRSRLILSPRLNSFWLAR